MQDRGKHAPSKGKQRELMRQEKKAHENKMKRLKRIGLAAGGAVAAASLVTGGIWASQQGNGSEAHGETTAAHVLSEPLIHATIIDSIDSINIAFGTNHDPDILDSKVIAVPRSDGMSAVEMQKWCSLFPCREALGAVTEKSGEPILYVNTSLLEYAQVAVKASPSQVKEMLKSNSFNELYHLITDRTTTPPSQELEQVYRNYIEDSLREQGLEEKVIAMENIGPRLIFETDIRAGATLNLLNELYSTKFMELMMGKIGNANFYSKGEEEKNGRFKSLPPMFSDLMKSLGGEESTMQILFSYQMRGQNEEWMRFVGAHFTENPQDQLKKGFNILAALDAGKTQQFYELIKK